MPQEYGILIYDIPKGNERLYHRILSRIRRRAIQMNLSVYLMPWGQRDEIQQIIDEARKVTGQYAAVSMLKFDGSDPTELTRVANECFLREIGEISRRLKERIEKARETTKEISDRYATLVERKLRAADGLVVVFGLAQETQMALEAVKRVCRAELEGYRSERDRLLVGVRNAG